MDSFEIEDLKYGKIKRYLDGDKVIYVIKDKIVEDANVIKELEIKYGFKLADRFKDIVY
jgi:hypothetical protein